MKKFIVTDSPVGKLTLTEEDNELVSLDFGEIEKCEVSYEETKFLGNVKKQLEEYFIGKRKKFDIKLRPKGTEFQRKVWDKLMTIPYGETASYKKVAALSGNEKASRAVGMANNKNPIPIIIPCHRVVGSNGKMVGYGGGLEIKEFLLNLEKRN